MKRRPLYLQRCTWGGGEGDETAPPGKFSKKLVNKSLIKSIAGDPLGNFVRIALIPHPGILAEI